MADEAEGQAPRREPKPRSGLTFHDLPLFATDLQIGEAVMGPGKPARHWAMVIAPALEKIPGFPKRDVAHLKRRYAPAVLRFYEVQGGLRSNVAVPDGPENPEAWHRKSSKPRLAARRRPGELP